MKRPFRVSATCKIGDEALDRLRQRGCEVDIYDQLGPLPKNLIVEKVRTGGEPYHPGIGLAPFQLFGAISRSATPKGFCWTIGAATWGCSLERSYPHRERKRAFRCGRDYRSWRGMMPMKLLARGTGSGCQIQPKYEERRPI
jgi:hypothetical protein